jgi:hypothetical protein
MKKHNLKVIEAPADELEAAIAAAEDAHAKLKKAEASFARKFPGDHRIIQSDVVGTVAVDPERYVRDPGAHTLPLATEFLQERQALLDLQREAQEADRAVERIRTSIAEAVTESEKRISLETAIAATVETDRLIDIESKTAGKLKALLDRARTAQTAAEAKLADAVRAVDEVMSSGLNDYLRENEGAAATATHDGLRAVRSRKIEAADEVEMAKSAVAIAERHLSSSEQKLVAMRTEIAAARENVAALAGQVAASAIPRLLEEAKSIQLELDGRRQVLLVLSEFTTVAQDDAISEYLNDLIFPYGLDGSLPSEHPAAAPWLTALFALSRNASAPLPKG